MLQQRCLVHFYWDPATLRLPHYRLSFYGPTSGQVTKEQSHSFSEKCLEMTEKLNARFVQWLGVVILVIN